MGRTVTHNIDEFGKGIAKYFESVQLAAIDAMQDVVDYLFNEVIIRMPVDTGDLENSLSQEVYSFLRNEEVIGRIFIDDGADAENYAYFAHEMIAPEGLRNRGPGTVEKGPQAGGGFMFRAIEDNRMKIYEVFYDGLRKRLKKL